ncbi:hypothetical protein GCM10027341_21280 [Spirosoma knui]
MMRLFIRLLLLPVLLGGLLGGCSERIEPKPVTYSQLLTGTTKKSWRLVSYQIFDEGRGSGVAPFQQTCVTDDIYTFYADEQHTFEISEGASKCRADDPDIYVADTWTLVNANASLEFYLDILGGKFPWTIKNLTDRSLTIEYYFPDIDASYRFTFNSISQ